MEDCDMFREILAEILAKRATENAAEYGSWKKSYFEGEYEYYLELTDEELLEEAKAMLVTYDSV
jgi:hypothetical protein